MSYKQVFCPSVSTEVVSLVESLNSMLETIPSNSYQYTSIFPQNNENESTASLVVLHDDHKAIAWISLKRLTDCVCEVRKVYAAHAVSHASVLSALESKAKEEGYTFIRVAANHLSCDSIKYYTTQGYRIARSQKSVMSDKWLVKNLSTRLVRQK